MLELLSLLIVIIITDRSHIIVARMIIAEVVSCSWHDHKWLFLRLLTDLAIFRRCMLHRSPQIADLRTSRCSIGKPAKLLRILQSLRTKIGLIHRIYGHLLAPELARVLKRQGLNLRRRLLAQNRKTVIFPDFASFTDFV